MWNSWLHFIWEQVVSRACLTFIVFLTKLGVSDEIFYEINGRSTKTKRKIIANHEIYL